MSHVIHLFVVLCIDADDDVIDEILELRCGQSHITRTFYLRQSKIRDWRCYELGNFCIGLNAGVGYNALVKVRINLKKLEDGLLSYLIEYKLIGIRTWFDDYENETGVHVPIVLKRMINKWVGYGRDEPLGPSPIPKMRIGFEEVWMRPSFANKGFGVETRLCGGTSHLKFTESDVGEEKSFTFPSPIQYRSTEEQEANKICQIKLCISTPMCGVTLSRMSHRVLTTAPIHSRALCRVSRAYSYRIS